MSKFTAVLAANRKQQSRNLDVQGSGSRRGGRSSDPNYQQTTIYISKELHRQAKRRLLDGEGQDFSGLVEELLQAWVAGE